MSINQRIFKDSVFVTVLTIVARALGFLLPVLIATLFGATADADAFYLANTIPTFLVNVFVVALSSAIVPVLVEQWTNVPEAAAETIGAMAGILTSLALLAIGVLAVLVPRALPYLAHGMVASSLSLSVELTLAQLPMILLSTLIGLLSAILNGQRRFAGPALVPGLRAIIVICAALIGYRRLGIYAVVLGLLSGELLSLLVLSLMAWRAGIRLRLVVKVPPTVRQILKLSVPLIVGLTVILLNPIIDRLMAGPLGEGSISALDYADKVLSIPVALLGSGFFVVALSHWSQAAADGKLEQLHASVQRAIVSVSFITVPLALFLALAGQPLVQLLFQRGAFDAAAVMTTAGVLRFLALGLVPNMIGLIFVRVQLVFQRTRVLMLLGLANALLNIVLNIVFIRLMGLQGIALSTSLTYLLVAIGLWLAAPSGLGQIFQRAVLLDLAKIGVSALMFSAVLSVFSVSFGSSHPVLALLGGALSGGIVYLYLSYRQSLDVATTLFDWGARRLRRVTAIFVGGAR